MKKILLCCLLATQNLLLAQTKNIELSGEILDETNNPTELATLIVRQMPDSAVIKTGFSETTGHFKFTAEAENALWLEIKYLGYKTHTSEVFTPNNGSKIFGKIILQAENTVLGGVTVTAKTPYLERRIDRLVVNVDALIANAASNTLEALERAPGIAFDPNGGLTLKGRAGVVVFVDDKPTYLSGTDLENYLRSLPANSIKRIEIMTNPPAKYEAAGSAGVINIVTKRNTLKGLFGSLSASHNQGRYGRSNNSINLSYNKKKVSIFSNASASIHNSYQDLNINRYYLNDDQTLQSSFNQNSYILKNGYALNGKIGLDFYASERTTLGFSVKSSTNPNVNLTDNVALVSDASQMLSARVIADNEENRGFKNGTYNINLRQTIDTLGGSLTFDADYVQYRSSNTQIYKNFIYSSDNSLDYKDQLDGNLPSNIDIFAFKTDLTKPLKQKINLQAGLKSALTKTDNDAVYFITNGGLTVPNYNLTNRFKYNEWIHAAYLNADQQFGKMQIQAGLRGEMTVLEGNQLGNIVKPDSSFTRKYSSLFPTFYAAYPLDAKDINSLSFSYGRRIDRPFFQDLNPFISPLDKFTYYTGNPNLLPTYAHNLSLTHSWKSMVNTSLNYSKTIDGIYETLEIVNGIYYSRPNNAARATSLTLSVEAAVPIKPWWNVNLYTEGGRQTYSGKLYTEQLDAKGNYIFAQIGNNFKLGKGWSADLSGIYQSDIVYAQLIVKSFGLLNTAIQKSVFNGKGTLKVAFNDILYTRRADGIINYLRLTNADWDSRLDTRQVAVAFSYRFGKSTSNKAKYNAVGSESEQKRVKT